VEIAYTDIHTDHPFMSILNIITSILHSIKWIYSYRPMYLVDEEKYTSIKNGTVTILVYAK
jgi:hypothetical protein